MAQSSLNAGYGSPEARQSADEMDERRQRNIAYEYLCHLEEAKKWMEAVLRESLPPTTELEENLRNGVYLAKLGHLLAPDIVPLSKIYDLEQRRYHAAGLQFRHTDNINYWLKSLEATALPKTFHPETTDVYDKKGMPRVIFCIHALSTHLYKLGRAPLIQDLYGKVSFTDAEIDAVQQELKKYGIQMPSFQKIGGILANNLEGDAAALHAAIIAINEIIDEGDFEVIFKVLNNPVARLDHVQPFLVERYQNMLREAKCVKAQAALNRSSNESYVPDVYDELLTHAEIQGHITTVNVQFVWDGIVKAVAQTDGNSLANLLLHESLQLKDVKPENVKYYTEEISSVLGSLQDIEVSDYRRILQSSVHQSNRRAKYQEEVTQAVKLVNVAVVEGSLQRLHAALANPVLDLHISNFALPLYLEEMKADRLDSGEDLTCRDIKASIQVLTRIADVSQAVDSGNVERTWDCLYNPDAHFTDLDPAFKVKYWQALTAYRQQKLEDNCECPILTYFDIQECVELVNQQCEDSNQVILALQMLNAAIKVKDSSAVMTALRNSALQLGDNLSSCDSALLVRILEDCWLHKQIEGAELWLEDVQDAVKYVLSEAEEAHRACKLVSCLNSAVWGDSEEHYLIEGLKWAKLKNYSAFQEQYFGKELKSKHPWIAYKTNRGNIAYLNMKTCNYSWTTPKDFSSHVQMSEKDIQNILNIVDANQNKITNKIEPLIICLQSHCRGYLLRYSLRQRILLRSIIKIQAWWRGVRVRHNLRVLSRQHGRLKENQTNDLLSYYQNHELKIVKLQALWRGRLARRAFLSLLHQAQPSFKVVRQFAPLLAVNPDDYSKEIQLQNLKGQVVQTIRHNKQLAQQLDAMDIKIGLLVHNRISLQDVEAHSRHLNDLAKGSALIDHTGGKGLKSLTKESRKLLEGYQNLFYMLQTTPSYLSKLMFCLPQTKSTKFLNTVILVLFNFGSNLRENYLLLRLFRTALQEEIQSKVQKPSDMITTVPHVMHLVFEYARQMVGHVSLRNMLGPLVQKILDNKTLAIDTNPIDIYKNWRNREEMMTGRTSDLPLVVNQEKALSYKEVQQKLKDGIRALKDTTLMFLEHITESRDLIPYGVLYMAKVLYNALVEKFPSAPEKDILKVVGNFIYYHFINSAIVGPDSFGIIDLPANEALTPVQRYNLASIAKILQFAASKKGFGEESRHLMCLNPFIIECHKKFKRFFRSCCEVEELENHYNIHQYSEATLISRPVIYITVEEICDTHKLLLQYQDRIVTDPLDPLCELLDEMGPAPSYEALLGTTSNDAALNRLAKTQLCLTLVNRYEVPEDDVTDINKLFIKAKELLVSVLPWLKGNSLLEGLSAPESEEEERQFADSLRDDKLLNQTCSQETRSLSLQESKRLLREYLCKLELAGLVSEEDGYQRIITALAHDLCNKGKYRQILMRELQTLRETKMSLDQKTKFYEEQVSLYNLYIEKCLENLTAGKRNVHTLKSSNKVPKKVKSKLVLKYTAEKLHEKGVLLEVEGLPTSQFKNVQFEIAPTDHNGVFTIRGKFMGVEMEKVDVNIQDLLQLQFEGISIMDMFGKAKVNVNLLLFLLNKKFYGKV